MRWFSYICFVACLGFSLSSYSYTEVVSVVGKAQINGELVRAGKSLPSKSTIIVDKDSVIQLLAGMRLSIGICGKAKVMYDEKKWEFVVLNGTTIRMAGVQGAIVFRDWRVELGTKDASVLLNADMVYVLSGNVKLARKKENSEDSFVGQKDEHDLSSGMSVSWEPNNSLHIEKNKLAGPAFEKALERSALYQLPDPWEPKSTKVDFAQIKRAEQWATEQIQTEREMASCGCTEGSNSSSGQINNQGATFDPLENRNAQVRVEINGLSPRLKK